MSADARAPRILVATEGSVAGAEAIRQAHAHASSVGGSLGVCHVLPNLRVHMLFPQTYAPEALQDAALEERARAFVGKSVAVAIGGPPPAFELFVEYGTEYVEIVRRADSWRASLIVVGHGEKHGLLGGVAEKVVRYARCPVLVARPPYRRGLVIAATDLSEASLPAVEAAVDEARRRGAKLTVLHTVEQTIPLGTAAPSLGITPVVWSPEMLHDLREAARVRIEATLAKLEARADLAIFEGRAGSAIVEYLKEHPPELVVVGTRGRTGFARVLLGNVAEHVVRAADTSVLVVRLPF